MSDNNPNPMSEIMSADDAIDDLPEIGVMDCYVRAKFMKALMEFYGSRPDGFSHPEFENGENALMNGGHEMVRVWAIDAGRKGIVSGWARRAAMDNRSEDFTVAVFDRITNDDWSRNKCVRTARAYLKDYLSGSMGMPDDRVIRETLKNY